jgi:hypothetical protein
MIIHRGTSPDNAIKIRYSQNDLSKADQIIAHYIDELFGQNDSDYFIHNSYNRTDNKNRHFRLMLIEDRDTIKHTVYFEYIKLD